MLGEEGTNLDKRRRRLQTILPYALKHRLLILLLFSVLIPLTLIGFISYFGIYNVLQNKVERGVEKNLEQERKGLESILSNLDYSSRQLAFEGKVGKDLLRYLSAEDPLEKKNLGTEIENYITLINYTNPLLGLTAYYLPDSNRFLFENLYINPGLTINSFHKIQTDSDKYTLHGPHRTLYVNSDNQVFSILRETDSDGQQKSSHIYVYIETNLSTIAQLFNSDPYGMPVTHLLLDQNHVVIYNGGDSRFPIGSRMDTSEKRLKGSVVFFQAGSKYGVQLAAVIAKSDYHNEMNTWLTRFALIGLVSLGAGLWIARLIWIMIYRPLHRLRKQFKLLGENRFHEPPVNLMIKEFDELLLHFYDMRQRVFSLMTEIEEKEIRKRHLEVEKLMYQMNPHFIHNTLNTAQWLARINGQHEIVRLLTIFTRVLNYNLGKEGKIVSIEEEIRAVKDYVELQQIRYNHQFQIFFSVEEDTGLILVPRFLLQPIVENAMYHGFKNKDGTIQIDVRQEGAKHLLITVSDNGEGIPPEKVKAMFDSPDEQKRKVGLGIGLSYVNNIVQMYYGEQYRLNVESTPGTGTTMILRLPVQIKEAWDDQNIDRRR